MFATINWKDKKIILVKVARTDGKRGIQQNESQNHNNPIAWEEKYSSNDFILSSKPEIVLISLESAESEKPSPRK